MSDFYKTVESIAEGLYKDRGSKFLSFIYPVSTEDEIKEIVTGIKEKYFDARHHCYAYSLGVNRELLRMNDDGEPSSTAGKPIYGQILSYDLTNVLIVVVRYFGGTKLGVSGLIQAYKAAAQDAIENAEIVERTVDEELKIKFSYLDMNDVMKILKEEEPEIVDRNFELECQMTLRMRERDMPRLKERLLKVETVVEIADKC